MYEKIDKYFIYDTKIFFIIITMAFLKNIYNNGIISAISEAAELQQLDDLVNELTSEYANHYNLAVIMYIYLDKSKIISKNDKLLTSRKNKLKKNIAQYDEKNNIFHNFNVGKKWSVIEVNALLSELYINMTITDISINHKRNAAGVESKIYQLSILNDICKTYVKNNKLTDRTKTINVNSNNVDNSITITELNNISNDTYITEPNNSDVDNKITNSIDDIKMVYVLKLEHNKYYVGLTKNINGDRIDSHFNNDGSEWTKKYKPIQVIKWIKGTKNDENNITLELMKQFGWCNVRGGNWCKVEMNEPPKELQLISNTEKHKLNQAVNKATNSANNKYADKIYLNVPFVKKDNAKKNGSKI
jgi:predicted GIY-YIG superfamily endonuclease